MSAKSERRRVEAIVANQGQACAWCGASISPRWVTVVERDAGPIGFCANCDDRYSRPADHPYMRRCLDGQGK